MEQKKNNYKHLVYVECMTYNQCNYIEDALRGFVMQRTDFPFVCMVMDDASTDGEQDVILSFLNREFDMTAADRFENDEAETIVAKHNVNENCTFVICFLKENHLSIKQDKAHLLSKWRDNSKYIAICEGDDYWTDPLKLQNQFIIMEYKPSVILCHTGFHFFFADSGNLQNGPEMPNSISALSAQKNILDHNSYRIQTCTVFFRMSEYLETLSEYNDCFSPIFMMGDTQLWVLLLTKGDVYYIPDSTAIYRISKESACRSSNFTKQLRFNVSCGEMRIFLMRRLSMPEDELFKKLYREYSVNALRYLLICPDFKPMFSLLKAHRFVYYLSHMPVFGNVLAKRIANRISIQ